MYGYLNPDLATAETGPIGVPTERLPLLPHRRTMRNREVASVHTVGEQGLRMQRVQHVQVFREIIKGFKVHPPRLREDAHRF